jgi:hypothetical protein
VDGKRLQRGRNRHKVSIKEFVVPLNYTATVLGPIYSLIGTTTQFVLNDDSIIELVALDKTSGVEVTDNTIDVSTIRPACSIRMADLVALEKAPEDLMEAVLEMNGVSWEVKSYFPRPSPAGERDGELYLILMESSA